MRALIIDDEPVARKVLREELEALPGFRIEVIGEAANGADGLTAIAAGKPDLVFLDIQMPEMDGFELLASLVVDHPPAVVMVTAYDQHALRAFEAGAIDYLLKPVSQERLLKCLERVSRIVGDPDQASLQLFKLQTTLRDIAGNDPPPLTRLVGKSGEGYYLLNLSEILAFQADGDLTWILTGRGRFQATQNLRSMEARLQGTSFRRIHRNALINVERVHKLTMISSQRWLLTLDNGKEFVVSKRQAHTIREVLHW